MVELIIDKDKIYKAQDANKNNILPGDPKGLPDDTLAFLDSGFLSQLSRYFGDGKHISYDLIKFSQNMANRENLILKKVFYFTAPPFQSSRSKKDEDERKRKYDKFISKIKKHELIQVEEGRVQRIKVEEDKFVFKQKGVDALLIMRLCFTLIDFPAVKKIILVTSDTDFCPVIKELKMRGLDIILYSFHTKKRNVSLSRTTELIKCCSKYIKLTKEDFDTVPLEKKEVTE